MSFSTIEDAISALANGEMIIVVDDEDRENEGDIVVAGDAVTPEAIAFMMKHARGLVCVSLPGERLDQLGMPLMVSENSESMKTAFTVSVDLLTGISTGISASDRAKTIRAMVDPPRSRRTLLATVTSSRSERTRSACLADRVIRRPQSISLAWQVVRPVASFARLPMTMAQWLAFRSFKSSQSSMVSTLSRLKR